MYARTHRSLLASIVVLTIGGLLPACVDIADLILDGNFRGIVPIRGRNNVSDGFVLRGEGNGTRLTESYMVLTGDVRGLQWPLEMDGSWFLIAARNDDGLHVVRHQVSHSKLITAVE